MFARLIVLDLSGVRRPVDFLNQLEPVIDEGGISVSLFVDSLLNWLESDRFARTSYACTPAMVEHLYEKFLYEFPDVEYWAPFDTSEQIKEQLREIASEILAQLQRLAKPLSGSGWATIGYRANFRPIVGQCKFLAPLW